MSSEAPHSKRQRLYHVESASKGEHSTTSSDGTTSQAHHSSWAEMVDAHYTKVDGFKIAKEYRTSLRNEGKFEETEALQYGEIDCKDFAILLERFCSDRESFIDIGSGTGKAVMVAAGAKLFKKATGIEIVETLHSQAVRASAELGVEVNLIHQDCFEESWHDYDVVFLPITCFTEEMVARVVSRIKDDVNTGAILIVTSTIRKMEDKGMCGPKVLRKLHEQRMKYGKGTMQFAVYEKK